MSFLRASFPGSGDFAPLFRLLDDYDDHRSSRNQSAVRSFSPRFDIRESEEAYHFDGELPGIDQKDIDIEFSDPQTLLVKGRTEREYHNSYPPAEAEEGKETDKTKFTHRFWASERSVGEFQRVFSFPTSVDQHNVKASLKHGILSIEVPKASAATSKKITIE
ncbi:Heat shock protein Hsp30/Hsp42, putative [Penicillium digitatum]|uniref:Heat shock protein Hsp30/Hsp42, putative n=3 Tax=Penicillium digitatum TaxID=36651 RepID=K9GMZ2_PEND2|nr:Heat shock protein Hsp30/Hsp42, putative [Penicillium digitatum Pd1]EKV16083.1 Heat shock protein Hsp30/Hsp42, putative [Penicillium digitatum PHI26]EKV19278.1 Heat shock protein Hsp30/Hsp42, putative [Penicillium digitatum Pd1]QQK47399.1 Heat shock protein Hsp30/Hsp42, putative [Penicillium digitatum]